MARIRSTRAAGRPVIILSGPLTAADMGRLEQACSPALTMDPLQLSIDIRAVTRTDATAAALLHRMAARGAIIISSVGQLC